jgi:hypothetical protein
MIMSFRRVITSNYFIIIIILATSNVTAQNSDLFIPPDESTIFTYKIKGNGSALDRYWYCSGLIEPVLFGRGTLLDGDRYFDGYPYWNLTTGDTFEVRFHNFSATTHQYNYTIELKNQSNQTSNDLVSYNGDHHHNASILAGYLLIPDWAYWRNAFQQDDFTEQIPNWIYIGWGCYATAWRSTITRINMSETDSLFQFEMLIN